MNHSRNKHFHWGRLACALGLCAALAIAALPSRRVSAGEPQLIAWAFRSEVDDQLYRIDVSTGEATLIGPVIDPGTSIQYFDIDGLTFGPDGFLYGVDDETGDILIIDPLTGEAGVLGTLDVLVDNIGLTFDGDGNLWLSDPDTQTLYLVDPSGTTTSFGDLGSRVVGLASDGTQIYGLESTFEDLVGPSGSGGQSGGQIVLINPGGKGSSVAPIGPVLGTVVFEGGLDWTPIGKGTPVGSPHPAGGLFGTLIGIEDGFDGSEPSQLFGFDLATLTDFSLGTVTIDGKGAGGFDCLAIPGEKIPPPTDDCGGEIAVQESLSFGTVAVGGTRIKTLTIANVSEDEDLSVSLADITGPFAIDDKELDFVLGPGETRSVVLVFQPTVRGRAVGELTILSSDCEGGEDIVSLVGAGGGRKKKVSPFPLNPRKDAPGTGKKGHDALDVLKKLKDRKKSVR